MEIIIEESYDGLDIIINGIRFHHNEEESFEQLVEVFKICCPKASVKYKEVY